MTEPADGIAEFESSLKELEGLIETLEKGELSLAEGLQHFERGVVLAKNCQATLEKAEQRVKTLMAENNFREENDSGE